MKKKYGSVFLWSVGFDINYRLRQDHAPGTLLVEEAGGIVTDSRGSALDFGLGRTLGKNHGIIACSQYLHPKVMNNIRIILREGRKRAKSREALAKVAATNEPPPVE